VITTEEGATNVEISRLIAESALQPVVLSRSIFRTIADSETPQGVAAEIAIPDPRARDGRVSVFLEGVQDPGNIGAIVRTAAAYGTSKVLLDRGCADAWSPKALRVGMGGHFALTVQHVADLSTELSAFKGCLISTVPRGGVAIEEADLTGAVGWIFGGEGRGLSEETLRKVPLRVSIPMVEKNESINVAAAAAICLYETFRRGS
jgi:TrmH family RNA methyltransferase